MLEITPVENRFYSMVSALKEFGRPLVVFGAGGFGRLFYQAFSRYGLEITCFMDNNPNKGGTSFMGLSIFSVEEAVNQYPNANVFVAIEEAETVEQQLTTAGFTRLYSYQPLVDVGFQYYPPEFCYYWFYKANQERFQRAYSLLADDFSKKTMENLIYYNMSRDTKYLMEIERPQQYYHPSFEFSEQEIFVDCGAFDGDTAQQFIDKVGDRYQKIYLIEPDQGNQALASNRLAGKDNIEIIGKATGCAASTVSFLKRGSMISRVDSTGRGDVYVQIDSLDAMLAGAACTFIKMDVQGHEVPSLLGAKQTIATYRPKLAICCYHLLTDLFSIIETLHSLCPEYKLYLSQHDHHRNYETVCYATL